MGDRTLPMTLTSGRAIDVRAWPTPVPGLMIAARPKGGWVIACASGRSAIGCFADPEAALACVTEIGPLADWDSASGGQIRMPIDVIRQVNGIVARWGGGEIAVKPDPPLEGRADG